MKSELKHLYLVRFSILIGICVILFYTESCYRGNREEKTGPTEETYQAIPTVCIWDKISARKDPSRNASVITPINLGEEVTYLGINAYDSTFKNQEYLKIKLSDGTLVWIPAFSLITGAKPAVITEEATIYLRPDMLTVTDKKISPMEIIAVTDEKDGWINFVSNKKNAQGWIQEDKINGSKEEIAFALMANRILTEKGNKSLSDKIDSVLNFTTYQNSIFIPILKEIGKKEREKEQVEEMMRQSIRSFQ